MSQEEQDAIYGRLKRQEKESKKVVAALEAKLVEIANSFRSVADSLYALSNSHIQLDPEFMQGLDRESVMSVCSELRVARNTAEQTAVQLRKFD